MSNGENDRILLANAPWRLSGRAGVRAGSRWPFTMQMCPNQMSMGYAPFPFFMAYATSVLKDETFAKVKMIDAVTEFISPGAFEKKVIDFKPTHIVLETSTPSIEQDLAWAKILKDYTKARIILTGPHSTTFADKIISENNHIDTVIQGEYDYSILDYNDTGVISPEYVKDLDKLPYPEWKDLPMTQYYDSSSMLDRPMLNVMASRGCPYDCSFCLWNQVMYSHDNVIERYRVRDPELVVEEIKVAQTVHRGMFKGVFFEDDCWGINKDWCHEFAEHYKSIVDLPYCVLSRADVMDYGTLKILKDSGLKTFRFGVESGSPEILKNINKQLDLSCVENVIDWCKKLGIRTEFSIAYGFTGESMDSVQETKKYISKLSPDACVQAIATPYPGTRFFNELDRGKLIDTYDWNKYDGFFTSVFHTDKMSREDLQNIFRRYTRQ